METVDALRLVEEVKTVEPPGLGEKVPSVETTELLITLVELSAALLVSTDEVVVTVVIDGFEILEDAAASELPEDVTCSEPVADVTDPQLPAPPFHSQLLMSSSLSPTSAALSIQTAGPTKPIFQKPGPVCLGHIAPVQLVQKYRLVAVNDMVCGCH